MLMEYNNMVWEDTKTAELQKYLSEGRQVAFTIRIPENLKTTAAETAELNGMSFSAFVRYCMIQELMRRI